MIRLFLLMSLIFAAPFLTAQETEEDSSPAPVELQTLVSESDLVALIRVLDTDYEYTRGFPSGGTAFLQVMIPYKVMRPLEDIIEVYDEGLRAGECYFDNPSVLEEGRRYLVFLKFSRDVKEQYNGLSTGCKLEVLVAQDGRYAVRYPLNGLLLADDVTTHVKDMQFQDSYAVLEDDEINPDVRNDLLSKGFLTEIDGRFVYTRGIDISAFRKLMGPDVLTLDRTLKK